MGGQNVMQGQNMRNQVIGNYNKFGFGSMENTALGSANKFNGANIYIKGN